MIQRKQSIWLLLIFVINISSVWLNIPFLQAEGQIDGKVIEDAFADIGFSYTNIDIAKSRVVNHQNSFLKYTTLLIAMLSAFCILLFKNRKYQKIIVKINYFLIVIQLFLMYYYGISTRYFDYGHEYNPVISLIFPFVSAWANFNAGKGINKDDELVKSYDRIR
ncbi:MAG: DUF4293 domain-containing protein [Bacteroidetes bacterium]|nr:DUF4293 domain-containing protein [Bacteroidota bacterium]